MKKGLLLEAVFVKLRKGTILSTIHNCVGFNLQKVGISEAFGAFIKAHLALVLIGAYFGASPEKHTQNHCFTIQVLELHLIAQILGHN